MAKKTFKESLASATKKIQKAAEKKTAPPKSAVPASKSSNKSNKSKSTNKPAVKGVESPRQPAAGALTRTIARGQKAISDKARISSRDQRDARVRQSYGERSGKNSAPSKSVLGEHVSQTAKDLSQKKSIRSKDTLGKSNLSTAIKNDRDARVRQSWGERNGTRDDRGNYRPQEKIKEQNRTEYTNAWLESQRLGRNEKAGVNIGSLKENLRNEPKNFSNYSSFRSVDRAETLDAIMRGEDRRYYIEDKDKVGATLSVISALGREKLSEPYIEEVFSSASPEDRAKLWQEAVRVGGHTAQTDRWEKTLDADFAKAQSTEDRNKLAAAKAGVELDDRGMVANPGEEIQYGIQKYQQDEYTRYKKAEAFVRKYNSNHEYSTADYLRDKAFLGANSWSVAFHDYLVLNAQSLFNTDRKGYYTGGFRSPYSGMGTDKGIIQNGIQYITNRIGNTMSLLALPVKWQYKTLAELSPEIKAGSREILKVYERATGLEGQRALLDAVRMRSEVGSENYSTPLKMVGTVDETLANILPTILLSIAQPEAGMALFAENAAGMYSRAALDSGATLEEALVYGTTCGMLEASIERLFPMAGTFGKSWSGMLLGSRTLSGKIFFDSTVKQLADSGFRNSMRGRILVGLGESLGEFTEEALMEVIEPFVQRSTFNTFAENASFADIGMAGLTGAAIAAVLHTPGMITATTSTLRDSVFISDSEKFKRAEFEDKVSIVYTMEEQGIISHEVAENRVSALVAEYGGVGSLVSEGSQHYELKTTDSDLGQVYSSRAQANTAVNSGETSAVFIEGGDVKVITKSGNLKTEGILTDSEKTRYAEKAEKIKTAKNEAERSGYQLNVRPEVIEEVSKLSTYYGRDIIFYEDKTAFKKDGVRGYAKGGKIYLNTANTTPAQTVIAHEMAHEMKGTQAYDFMLNEVKEYYADSFEAKKDELRGYGYKEHELEEEVLAHFVEQKLLTDEGWIYSFLSANGKRGERFANVIIRGINNIIQKGFGGKEQRFLANVRTKWLKALREESKAQNKNVPAREAAAMAQGQGYDGYSMSVNAREAYERGEKPKSKWTKKDILAEVAEIDETKVEMIRNVKVDILRDKLLDLVGWHHTSSRYNKTNFYVVDERAVRGLTEEKVASWTQEKKEASAPNSYRGDFKYLEWSGTRRHPKATERNLTDVNIEERGSFYIVTDDNGNQLVRKKIGSNGTYATSYAEEERRAQAAKEREENRIANSTEAANALYSELSKKGMERSYSGNIYERGRKPSRFDYLEGIENFFREGEQRLAPNDGGGYQVETFTNGEWVSEDGVRYAKGRISEADVSYDALVSKPDMKVASVPSIREVPLKEDGAIDRKEIVRMARESVRGLKNPLNTERQLFVSIKDLNTNALVSQKSINHSLARNKMTAAVTMNMGEILENSIVVNELNPRGTERFSYLALGVAKSQHGHLYIVRSIINVMEKNVAEVASVEVFDRVFSIQAKERKTSARDIAPFEGTQSSHRSLSTISIRELLDFVKDTYPEILSMDVLRHYGIMERPKSDLEGIRYAKGRVGAPRFIVGDKVINDGKKATVTEVILDRLPEGEPAEYTIEYDDGKGGLAFDSDLEPAEKAIERDKKGRRKARFSEGDEVMFTGIVADVLTGKPNKKYNETKAEVAGVRTIGFGKNRAYEYSVLFPDGITTTAKEDELITEEEYSRRKKREEPRKRSTVQSKSKAKRERDEYNVAIAEVIYNRTPEDRKEFWDRMNKALDDAERRGAFRREDIDELADFAYRTGYQISDGVMDEEYKTARTMIPYDGTIHVPERYRGEMESLGGLQKVNRRLFGSGFRFSYSPDKAKGASLDDFYGDLAEVLPGYFPETMDPSEQMENFIDFMTAKSQQKSLSEIDEEDLQAMRPFADENHFVGLRDYIARAIWRALNAAANRSSKVQEAREAGREQGEKKGRRDEAKDRDRLDRATMREFDRLERSRAKDREREDREALREDEATMREFDRVLKGVRKDERALSRKEKKELREEFKNREKEIKEKTKRAIKEIRVEMRSWKDAAERIEAERRKRERQLETAERRAMREKQRQLDKERRKERIKAAIRENRERRKAEEDKTSTKSLFNRNRGARVITENFRMGVLDVASRLGAFHAEGDLLLDDERIVIARLNEASDGYKLTRDRQYVPSFGLTLLAQEEGLEAESFYGVYAELQKMRTERDEESNRVYTKKDILKYIEDLDTSSQIKEFLYFDVMRYSYDQKPTYSDGGEIKIKARAYKSGKLGEAIDNICLDMFAGAGRKIAVGDSAQVQISDVDAIVDLIFPEEGTRREAFRGELVEMIVEYEADMEESRMEEATNLLTDTPKESDSWRQSVFDTYRNSKKLFLAEGEAFERLASVTKRPLIVARYYAAKSAGSVAKSFIGGKGGVRSLNGAYMGKTLSEIMQPAIKDENLLSRLTKYLYAQHNIDRMKYGKGFMELSAEECQSIVDELGKDDKVTEIADEIVEYGQHLLRLCVESGMISEVDFQYFIEKYPHYVPTFRLRHDEYIDRNGNVVRRKNRVINEAVHSTADILPLYDQLVRRTQEIVKACKKNQLAGELVKVAKKPGTAEYIINVKPAEPSETSEDDYVYGIGQIEDRGLTNRDTDGTDNIIPVYIDGVKYNIEVADKNILYGWDRLNYYRDEEAILKAMRLVNSARRGVLTQYNPIFWMTNGIKDTVDMYLYNQHAHRLPVFQLKAAMNLFRKGKGWESFREYLSHGAAHASIFEYDQRRAPKIKRGAKKLTVAARAFDRWNFLIEQWPRYTVYLEEVDRLSKEQKKKRKERGRRLTEEEIKTIAAYRAADATVNFGRSGTWVKAANTYGATFLNAGIQGMDRFRRMFVQIKGDNAKETMLNVIGLAIKLAGVGLAPSMLMDWLYGGDDEEANAILQLMYGSDANQVMREFAEMADYQRTNYLNIKINGIWFHIPKGRVVSFLYGFKYNGMKVYEGDMNAKEMVAAQWELFSENILPGNPLTSNIAQPLIDVAMNRDHWGNEIVSQWDDAGEGFHWTESTEDTTRLAALISEKLHGIVDLSPIKMDYVFQQYLGSWNNILSPFVNAIADGQDQRVSDMLKDAFHDSMWGKFVLDPIISNRLAGDYYDLKEEFTNQAANAGNDTPYAVALKVFDDYDDQLGPLRAAFKVTSKDASLTWSERLKEMRRLKEEMNEIYRMGVADAKEALRYASTGYLGKDANKEMYDQWQADTKGPEWQIEHGSEKMKEQWNSLQGDIDSQSFVDAYNFFKTAASDRDAEGKAIKGQGKKDKFTAFVESRNLTADQKMMLFMEVGGYKKGPDIQFTNGGTNTSMPSDSAATKENAEYLPLKNYKVSSEFGVNRGTHTHSGIDLAVPDGTDVAAVKKGVVTEARNAGGYGLRVVVDHGDGMKTTYNHLSDIGVSVGEEVSAGKTIAKSGNTGHSTGPHLHFEVMVDGNYVNPREYFDFGGGKIAPGGDSYTSKMSGVSGGVSSGGGGSSGKRSGGSRGSSNLGSSVKAIVASTARTSGGKSYSRGDGSSRSGAGRSQGDSSVTAKSSAGVMLPTAKQIKSNKAMDADAKMSVAKGVKLPTAKEIATASSRARIGYGAGTSATRRTRRTNGRFWDENVLG